MADIFNADENVTLVVAPAANVPVGLNVRVDVVAPVTLHEIVAGFEVKLIVPVPKFLIVEVTVSAFVKQFTADGVTNAVTPKSFFATTVNS